MCPSEIPKQALNSSDLLFGQDIQITGPGAATTVGLRVAVPSGSSNYAAQFTGDVQINGTTLTTSDMNLKKNIEEVSDALTIINGLSPRTYQYKEGTRFGFDDRITHYGFLAQEVEEVLPSLVKDVSHAAVYRADYTKGVTDGREGDSGDADEAENIIYPSETFKAVRYTEFIPILVQAVKEQQQEIDALNLSLLDKSAGTSDNGSSPIITQLQNENTLLKESITTLQESVTSLREEINQLKNCTDCFGSRREIEPTAFENLVSVYPNPARSQVTVNTKVDGEYQIKVLTADGRLLLADKYRERVVTLNTTKWVAGTYLFEISTLDGAVMERIKVVVID